MAGGALVALLTRDRFSQALREPRAALAAAAALLRGRWYVLRYRLSGVDFRVGRNFRCYGRFVVAGRGRVVFGDDVVVRKNLRHVYVGSSSGGYEVVVGDRVWLHGTTISCRQRVEIGARSLVGRADIVDHEFHDPRDPERAARVRTAPVVIESDVWIGNDCLILKGVRIGRHSVLGARTVARRSLPERVVAIGNPARVVKELDFGGSGGRAPQGAE